MIIIVVVGAVLLVGGIFPKTPQNTETPREAIPDPSSLTLEEKKSLQLKALKFKECTETITIDLLLDRTDSMVSQTPSGQTKISRLKEAVLTLTGSLSDNSIIGIQSFSSESITEDVPISYYRDVKNLIPPAVNSYRADGSTPTYAALIFSYQKLQEALPKFPGRQFNFILVSDGQPFPPGPPSNDPRDYNPNPANQIKALGVNVYALAIYDRDQAGNPALANLLKSIASKPENYFQAESADDTTKLLALITEKICGGQAPSK